MDGEYAVCNVVVVLVAVMWGVKISVNKKGEACSPLESGAITRKERSDNKATFSVLVQYWRTF
jgi:hypothetical protein